MTLNPPYNSGRRGIYSPYSLSGLLILAAAVMIAIGPITHRPSEPISPAIPRVGEESFSPYPPCPGADPENLRRGQEYVDRHLDDPAVGELGEFRTIVSRKPDLVKNPYIRAARDFANSSDDGDLRRIQNDMYQNGCLDRSGRPLAAAIDRAREFYKIVKDLFIY